MKIAFDAKRLFYNHTGLGNYSRSLVRHISQLDPDYRIFLFTPKIRETKFEEFTQQPYEVVLPDQRFLWRYSRMVSDLLSEDCDVFHGLSNEIPLGIRRLKNTKTVVTIHDLIFLQHPEFYPFLDRIFYKEKFKRACEESDEIIAVSVATKEDIIRFFGIRPEKITVIYQACSEIYYEDGKVVTDRENYGLFVSSLTERKNLKVVVEAVNLIKSNERPLIKVVGEGGVYKRKMQDLISRLKLNDHFDFVGKVENSTLKSMYEMASFSIYPSFYEGFGIPIVESLLCGTPVITSNLSSMPEAAQGHGILIDPTSSVEVAEAMKSLLKKPMRIEQNVITSLRSFFHPSKRAQDVLKLYKE